MGKWINCLLWKQGVSSLIPGFTNLLDETKLWPSLHMTLTVGGMLITTSACTTLLIICLNEQSDLIVLRILVFLSFLYPSL